MKAFAKWLSEREFSLIDVLAVLCAGDVWSYFSNSGGLSGELIGFCASSAVILMGMFLTNLVKNYSEK